jgi:hypothetical protein
VPPEVTSFIWIRTRFGDVQDLRKLTTDGERIDKLIAIEDFAGLDAAESGPD